MVLCYNFGIDPGLVGFLCCLLVNFHSFPPHWESFPTLSPLVCLPVCPIVCFANRKKNVNKRTRVCRKRGCCCIRVIQNMADERNKLCLLKSNMARNGCTFLDTWLLRNRELVQFRDQGTDRRILVRIPQRWRSLLRLVELPLRLRRRP